jgi:hypothetical protein
MADLMRSLSVTVKADYSVPVRRHDPTTGEPLENPEPYAFAGLEFVGEQPTKVRVPVSWVSKARAAGWVTVEGERLVVRPGGPANDPNRPDASHTFVHFDVVVLHTVDGPARYLVSHQPDKYADDGVKRHGDDTAVTAEQYAAGQTRVDWFYDLVLEG